MKTLKIQKIFTDLTEAIQESNQAYGIEYYGKSLLQQKRALLNKVARFYLMEDKSVMYVTWFKIASVENGKYGILHEFSWSSMLSSGGAAIVQVDRERMEIRIGEYQYNRDDLRKMNGIIWTT